MTRWTHECNHPDHVRYGPGSPGRISDEEMSRTASLIHENKRKRAFQDFMDGFNNSTISTEVKKAMFKSSIYAPSSLTFSDYGIALYQHGMAMALSYKSTCRPDYIFDFEGESVVILKHVGEKRYEKVSEFPIQAIELSIKTERSERGELLHMHATHRQSFYPSASLNSASL